MTRKNILLIEGDGIGPEVVAEAKKILDFLSENTDKQFDIDYALLGGIAYDKTGTPFPDETLEKAKNSDAILLGAVGGPKWEELPYNVRPERGLLGIRKELELFANLRPAIVFDALIDSSSLKSEIVSGLDIMIVRELTGGIYFGEPRGVITESDGTKTGFNTLKYNSKEVDRIAKVALDLAQKRNKKLCSIDKANVLESTEMWREQVTQTAKNYSDIELTHMYVDNASMQLVRYPKQFDVIVTTNMFGDIISDTASMLTGSLGMLPSASLGEKRGNKQYALYEPVHGSAPDIAGQNIANPIATISSLSMMLRYSFDYQKEADLIDHAIKDTLNQNYRTKDIAKNGEKIISTTQMGEQILRSIKDNI
jgi:3-isopropylmalate dehydrogenase